ncbi:hypothetical protein KJ966_07725 [bacterium]|nr:hypothetical protein [bacterium]
MNRVYHQKTKFGRVTVILILLTLIFSLLSISCKEEKEPGQNDESSSDIAENMVDNVGSRINLALDGVPEEVLAHLKSCATSQLVENNLLASADSAAIATAVATGMMQGLGDYSDDQLSDTPNEDTSVKTPNKKIVIAAIVNKLTLELAQSLSGEELETAVGNVVAAVTGAFKTAGIDGTDMGVVAREVIAGTLQAFKEKAMDDDTMFNVSLVAIQSAIAGIGDDVNGLSGEEMNTAVKKAVAGLVYSLDAVGILKESIISNISDIISAAITGIGMADVEAGDYVGLCSSVKNGFISGLQEIGVTNIEINAIYSDIENACAEALNDLILSDPDPVTASSLISTIHLNLASIDSATNLTLTDSQKSTIKSNLDAVIANANLSTSDDLEKIIPAIIEDAAKSIADMIPQLSDEQKVDVYRNILESCQEFLIGKLSGEEAVKVLVVIAESSVNYFNGISINSDNYASSIKDIANSLTKSLDVIPLGDKSIADAAPEIVGAMVETIDLLGLTEPIELETIESIVTGAVKGISEADLNRDDLIELIGIISEQATNSAIKNKVDAGKTESELISIVDDVAKSILDGLTAAGVSTADCADMADSIIQGAASELGRVLTAEELNEALTNAVGGIINGLDEAGATDEEKATAESSATEAVDSAVSDTADPTEPKLITSDENLMTEEGADEKGSFKVSLDKKPASNITVSIVSKDTTEGTVSPSFLIFNSTNWNQTQVVFINPVDEGYVDGEIKYNIVVSTNGGARKTLIITNMDNDKVGIKVTPSKKQYSSEVGGQAWFYVNLTSQPKGPIRLRWAITIGQSSIFFNPNETRIMDFSTTNYGTPQRIIIEGKECLDCEEHASASIESQNIISLDGNDGDYPELRPETISLVNLKGGPKIMTTSAVGNDTVTVTFDAAKIDFSNDDDKFIYETVFATESITMTYARYQSRPLLIKESECFNGDNVKLNITTNPGDPTATPPVPPSSSFTFCLKFYNANTGQTASGMNNWATANGFIVSSCTGNGATPNYITCEFNGSGSTLPSSTIPQNTIFSDEKIGNASCSLNGGSGYYSSPPLLSPQTSQPAVTLNYKTLSISGANTAQFKSSSGLQPGLWYLSDKSKSYVYGGSINSASIYHYIDVAP